MKMKLVITIMLIIMANGCSTDGMVGVSPSKTGLIILPHVHPPIIYQRRDGTLDAENTRKIYQHTKRTEFIQRYYTEMLLNNGGRYLEEGDLDG